MVPSETQFADTLIELLGEENAKVVLGVPDVSKATDAWVRETIQKEGLFSGKSRKYLFGRVKTALAGQRSILSIKPEYATQAAQSDDLNLYFDSLFGTKDALSKEKLTKNKKTAELFLLPLFEFLEDNTAGLYQAMIKDLAVFLTVVSETAQVEFNSLQSEGNQELRMTSLNQGQKSSTIFTRISIAENIFTQFESSLLLGRPDVVFQVWMRFKRDIFHESIHFAQKLDSELMIFLSTFILKALYTQMQEQQEKEQHFGSNVIDDFYMLLPHETESYTASAFVEHLGERMQKQCSEAAVTVEDCADKLETNNERWNSQEKMSVQQKITIIESSVKLLELFKEAVLHVSKPVTQVSFGSSELSEYEPSPVDILSVVQGAQGLRAVTLQYARSTFSHHVDVVGEMIKRVEPQLGNYAAGKTMLNELHERLQNLA